MGDPVITCVRAELRARWRSTLGVGLLCGLAAAVALAMWSAVLRSQTVHDRFLEESNAADLGLFTMPEDSHLLEPFVARPEVDTAVPIKVFAATDAPDQVVLSQLTLEVGADGRWPTEMDIPKLVRGRFPHADRHDEAVLSHVGARETGLDVGDTVTMHLLAPDQEPYEELPAGPTLTLTVVGIEAAPGHLPPVTDDNRFFRLRLTPAFVERYGDRALALEGHAVRLRADPESARTFADALTPAVHEDAVFFFPRQPAYDLTQRSVIVQANVVGLLSALVSLATVVAVIQMVGRLVSAAPLDRAVLEALGMPSGQRRALGVVRAGCVGLVAAAVAIAGGWLLSGLGPVGTAAIAETAPGPWLPVWLASAGACTLVVVAVTTAAAVRTDRRTAASRRRMVQVAPGFASVPSLLVGIRLATERGRGQRAVPTRVAAVAAVIGVGLVATALGVATSMGRTLDTPRLYGVNYDIQVGDLTNPVGGAPATLAVAHDPLFEAVGVGRLVPGLSVAGGDRVFGLAVHDHRGSVGPTVVDGRAPEAADEILLGVRTLGNLDVAVGDEVEVSLAGGGEARMRVVGAGVFPVLAGGIELGHGVTLTFDAVERLGGNSNAVFGLVSVAPDGRGEAEAALASVDTSGRGIGVSPELNHPLEPADVVALDEVRAIPTVTVGVLAAIALGVVAATLGSSVRRRRADHALLAAMGFTRGQRAAAVMCQALLFAGAAVVIGIPLGAAGGRWLWSWLAERLSVVAEPVTPTAVLVLVALAVVLAAVVAAVVPARAAARIRPAVTLRRD